MTIQQQITELSKARDRITGIIDALKAKAEEEGINDFDQEGNPGISFWVCSLNKNVADDAKSIDRHTVGENG